MPQWRGVPWDGLRKILHRCQMMVKVQNGEEILPKVSASLVGRTNIADNRRICDSEDPHSHTFVVVVVIVQLLLSFLFLFRAMFFYIQQVYDDKQAQYDCTSYYFRCSSCVYIGTRSSRQDRRCNSWVWQRDRSDLCFSNCNSADISLHTKLLITN